MRTFISALLMFSFMSAAVAENSSSYPQRCFFSGTYDEGYFTKTIWDMFVADKTGGDMSKFLVYSFVRITDIPRIMMQPGTELDELLKLKIIAVARFLPTQHASHEVLVLRKDSFQFVNENYDLSQFVILMKAFGDQQPVLMALLQDHPENVLQSRIVGPIEESNAVCNYAF